MTNPLMTDYFHAPGTKTGTGSACLRCLSPFGSLTLVPRQVPRDRLLGLRIGAGIQVTAILLGWFYIQFPVIVEVKDAGELTFYNTQAPAATLEQLFIALIVGLVLVVPGFVFLFKVFKIRSA